MKLEDTYQFCPKCGEKYSKDVAYFKKCFACGHTHYPNPVVSASVIAVSSDKKVLFARRTNSPGKGSLCFPGGFAIIGETFEECAARELREEASVEVNPQELRYYMSGFGRYDFEGVSYPTLGVVYLYISDVDIESAPGEETQEVLFFSKDEFPTQQDIFESQKGTAKKFLAEFDELVLS